MIPIIEDFPQIAAEMKRLAALKADGIATDAMAKAVAEAKPAKPPLDVEIKIPWSFLPGMPKKPPLSAAMFGQCCECGRWLAASQVCACGGSWRPVNVAPAHDKDCDWHTDQYWWECTCYDVP